MRMKWLSLLAVLALVLAACGYSSSGDDDTTTAATAESEDPAVVHGQKLYDANCAACHGPNAEGVENLGTMLVDNAFIQSTTDEELVAFIIQGRAADDPDNVSGIPMPARGNNPDLTDEDIADIVAFLRTLQ